MHGLAWQAPSQCKQTAWEPVCTQLLREWIEAGQPAWLPLSGGSMTPFLPSGSKVLVSQTAPRRIFCGDLVVYEVEGRMICHRVLGRRTQGFSHAFLMKGDGWRMTDPWVCAEQVIGKVIAINRNGSVVRLDTPLRRLQAVAAAALSFVVAGTLMVMRQGKQLLSVRLKRL
jgi:signal peptidase I